MLKSGNEGSGCNGDGKRFVVRADEKLTAFLELEAAVRLARCGRTTAARERKPSKTAK
jgi:hypothetical protein